MDRNQQGKALAIYIGESDHLHGKPLYIAIVEEAKRAGIAGATVGRAFMGFGAHSKIHTNNIVLLSEDLPVVVSIVDRPEKIAAFLPTLEEMVVEGTIVSWDVIIELHRPKPS
jgi:PII-like signaling protein